jgi:hypothetical protein
MIDATGRVFIESRKAGSRNATRVRIQSPVGSRYDGQVGVVVDVSPVSYTVLVRLGENVLPFGLSELVVLS